MIMDDGLSVEEILKRLQFLDDKSDSLRAESTGSQPSNVRLEAENAECRRRLGQNSANSCTLSRTGAERSACSQFFPKRGSGRWVGAKAPRPDLAVGGHPGSDGGTAAARN
ncbi:MAG: hypothetical protein QXS54_06180 [Candidatus Methanomethylicaceae archaeon]